MRIFGNHADTLPPVEVWQEVLRLLKPGGWLLAFGSPRNWDRLTFSIREAGFEVRDQIMWIRGAGFPRAQDVGKQIDRRLGAQRQQLLVDSVDKRFFGKKGDGKQWMDGPDPVTDEAKQWDGYGDQLKGIWEPIVVARKPPRMAVVDCALAHGTGALNLKGCRIGDDLHYNNYGEGVRIAVRGRWPSNLIVDEIVGAEIERQGGDASFFYCPRPTPAEAKDNPHGQKKPIRLLEYLARKILPPARNTPRRLLVPYSGSGSEIIGALNAGWEQIVGIEMNLNFVKVAHRRITKDGYWQAFICRGNQMSGR
jgi:site-specific DNA-methyltransferase (adenine-specific)